MRNAVEKYINFAKGKPLEALERIYSHLRPVGTPYRFAAADIIDVFEAEEPPLVFIRRGRFSVQRRDDGLILLVGNAPVLFGVAEYFMPMQYAVLVAESRCDAIKVPMTVALSIFDSESLWRDICQVQTYYFRVMSVRDSHTTGVTTYAMIRNVLLELMEFPAEVRATLVVLSYIQQRTKISRSMIAKILAALRGGDYITMEHGHLMSIKTLPREY